MISEKQIQELRRTAYTIRCSIIEMLVHAKSGHTAGPLGMADIFTALYFNVLRHDPHNPLWKDRDRLFLSNGHICPVLYATLAHAGYFDVSELSTLRTFGSRLQGHPERQALPGLESTSGPLGSGLSQACGYALAGRIDNPPTGGFRVYCVMSDGEQQEGNTWEAVMFAGAKKLSNLTAIMDRNNIQIDGDTEDVMPLEPIKQKYEAFNWKVIEVDGHDIAGIVASCDDARENTESPTLILAHTTPGKGVPEIENDYRWHGMPPNEQEGKRFLEALAVDFSTSQDIHFE